MLPRVVETIADVRAAIADARSATKKIGLVPTMGALHAGHASLIRSARASTDFTVVSIFVNPMQFGPSEDFNRYPRPLEADRELCGAVGTELIFAPSAAEIYPPGYCTYVDVAGLGDQLCGKSRPGHFRGVATVVLKLLNIVQPDVAYFGQKDWQQARIIQTLVGDLNLPLEIKVLPTVREPDGLAMSSRNRYLDPIQRGNAAVLFRSLQRAQELLAKGERDARRLESALAADVAATAGARLDYGQVVDAIDLQPIESVQRPAVAALAVYFGTTRLIDNVTLTP